MPGKDSLDLLNSAQTSTIIYSTWDKAAPGETWVPNEPVTQTRFLNALTPMQATRLGLRVRACYFKCGSRVLGLAGNGDASMPRARSATPKGRAAAGLFRGTRVFVSLHGQVWRQTIQTRGVFESLTLVRFGELTADEHFVSEDAASASVTISNLSATKPLVMLKHFGSVNAENRIAQAAERTVR